MPSATPFRSVQSIGPAINPFIAGQLGATFRDLLHGPEVVHDERFILYVTGQPHPFGNAAFLSRPDDPHAASEAVRLLAPSGAPQAIVLPDAPDADSNERLTRAGFAMFELMPNMAIDVPRLKPVALPDGYSFVRVVGDEQADRWVDAFAAGYELPRPVAALFSPRIVSASAALSARYQFFFILRNGQPVATSMMNLKEGVTGIYCISTIPAERGKGLGAFVTAQTLHSATAQGYSVGILQASAAGHPVYRRLGFAEFGAMRLFVKIPA